MEKTKYGLNNTNKKKRDDVPELYRKFRFNGTLENVLIALWGE